MAGFKTSSDDSQPLSEINITPFVDVMLVLLIIFMVAAPLLESGISVQLPKAATKSIPMESDPVVLTITKEKKLFLGKNEISKDALESKLKDTFKKREQKEILIRADTELAYGVVASTMALVKNSGIHKIGLMTDIASPSKSIRK
ncbi:MAG: protein TolR [Pseudomonadota bacterium]